MGDGKRFCCNQCGHTEDALFGIGFRFPELYSDVVEEIKKGKYGREWKRIFETVPGAAVNAEKQLYVCPACGSSKGDLNLSLYEPVNPNASHKRNTIINCSTPSEGMEYVMPYELAGDYRLLKAYVHKCVDCGARMHQYRDGEKIICSKCKKGEMEPIEELRWD